MHADKGGVRRCHALLIALGMVLVLSGCETPWFTLTWAPVDLSQPRTHTPSQVLGATGTPIGAMQINRHEAVTREQIPEMMVHALVSAEDRRFFEHNGIDVRGIARAFKANQEEGRVVQGGSTITQQLVKNLYLDATDKTLSRKAKEANMAMKLEEIKTKDEILTDYCNSVYLGNGAYGMQAGATVYFNQPIANLSVQQIALLVGLLRRPEGANPYTNPDGAIAERNRVLNALHTLGHIDDATLSATTATPLEVQPPPGDNGQRYPRLMESIRRQIVDSGVLGWGEEDTMNRLYSNGYTISTTINPSMQDAAEVASRRYLSGNAPEAAVVLMDPTNGHVRAMVGGRDFERSQFDLATQGRRQPGSVFKVVGLAAALEQGIPATQTYDAGSGEHPLPNGETWAFKSAQPPGPMSLADGLVVSSNGVYARLGIELGGDRVAAMATTLGITTPQEGNVSNILGGVSPGVTPYEMASAFATLANHGVRHDPVLVTSIMDRYGNELLTPPATGQAVISPQTADTITHLMTRVISEGTGKAAEIGRPVAGKTGTVNNNTDAWFVGYTPDLVGAVWVGYPNELKPLHVKGFGTIQGGNLPATIWAQTMKGALASSPPQPFTLDTPIAAGVTPPPPPASTTPAPPTMVPIPPEATESTVPGPTVPPSPSPYRPDPIIVPQPQVPTVPAPPAPRPQVSTPPAPVQPAPAIPAPSPPPASTAPSAEPVDPSSPALAPNQTHGGMQAANPGS